MTSPRFATTTDTGRYYTVPGFAEQFDSVTSILHVLNAPAITFAAAKRAAECAVNEEAAWHAIQQEQGDEAAIKFIKEAPKRHMQSRGDIGTRVHHACEAYVLKGESSDDAEIRPYLDAYSRWLDKAKPEIVAVEQTVFHPDYKYAGTADLIVRMDGKTYIGDLKSGWVGDKAALQMCAYANATYRVHGDTSEPVPWVIDGALVLDIKPNKCTARWCDVGPNTWRAFRAAIALNAFDHRRDVFGSEWR